MGNKFICILSLSCTSVLVLFLPYWIVTFRILFDFPYALFEPRHSLWNKSWFYGCWIVSSGLCIFVFVFFLICCHSKCVSPRRHKETAVTTADSLVSVEFPSGLENHGSTKPFRLVSLPAQFDWQVTAVLERHRNLGINFSYEQIQPTVSNPLLFHRPSEADLAWDHENLPWLDKTLKVSSQSTFKLPSQEQPLSTTRTASPFHFDISEQVDEDRSFESPLSESFMNQNSEILSVQFCAGYYQLTPTGSPSSSSSVEENSSLIQISKD